jgi:hypothetical protein
MFQSKLIQEAHCQATQILHECATGYGYRASGLAAGYPQVWCAMRRLPFWGQSARATQR